MVLSTFDWSLASVNVYLTRDGDSEHLSKCRVLAELTSPYGFLLPRMLCLTLGTCVCCLISLLSSTDSWSSSSSSEYISLWSLLSIMVLKPPSVYNVVFSLLILVFYNSLLIVSNNFLARLLCLLMPSFDYLLGLDVCEYIWLITFFKGLLSE